MVTTLQIVGAPELMVITCKRYGPSGAIQLDCRSELCSTSELERYIHGDCIVFNASTTGYRRTSAKMIKTRECARVPWKACVVELRTPNIHPDCPLADISPCHHDLPIERPMVGLELTPCYFLYPSCWRIQSRCRAQEPASSCTNAFRRSIEYGRRGSACSARTTYDLQPGKTSQPYRTRTER